MKKVTLLGSTGSIGVSTLDVLSRHPDQFEIFALSGHHKLELLAAQCQQFRPRYVVLSEPSGIKKFTSLMKEQNIACTVLVGEAGLNEIASHPEVDIVMAAIVGAAGLSSTLAALAQGKKVLLANKEALVMAGDLVLKTLQHSGGQLIPVDSEHSAIFQCLPRSLMAGRLYPKLDTDDSEKVALSKIVLTASGGATRDLPLEALSEVTPAFACTHPNWSMGKKITVDSATMMNKALEVIEASFLFGVSVPQVEVMLHPQSIIHSMVYYQDGSVLAQCGQPDMRTPIAVALAWPSRVSTAVPPLDFTKSTLTFLPLDSVRYPCLSLGYEALRQGGLAPTVLNAANEIAVERFLAGHISFTDIVKLNETMLIETPSVSEITLEVIKLMDQEIRAKAKAWISHAH